MHPDLTIKFVNRTARQWYERNAPLVGKKCFEAFHNRTSPCDPCPSLLCMKSGQIEYKTAELPGQEGGVIEVFSYPLKNSQTGEIEAIIEFGRDITL